MPNVNPDNATHSDESRARKTTIIDVAREARVSFKTVSRVINNERHVSDELRARVRAAIDKLSFTPNLGARVMSGVRNYALGILYDETKGNYLLEVQNAIMQVCREAGYHLTLETVSRSSLEDAVAFERQVRTLSIDGLVVLPPLCDHDGVLSALEAAGMAYNRIAPTKNIGRSPAVVVDDAQAVRSMVRHLWALGHRRIGFIAGREDHPSAHVRQAAFLEETQRLNGAPMTEWLRRGDFSSASGVEQGGSLLDEAVGPTAIFASNDEMAAGVISAALDRGLALPRELSICGFDDGPTARLVWPALTTIYQPLAEMARCAAWQLIRADRQPAIAEFTTELVERRSTAQPPTGTKRRTASATRVEVMATGRAARSAAKGRRVATT